MDEVEVLSDDLCTWTGEIQRVGLLGAAKVMQFEDQMTREIRLVAPDDPSHTSIHQSKLVSRSVDGLDAWELKVPAMYQS